MLWCQGTQYIGLCNHKLKSALKCLLGLQCMLVPDRWTNRQTDRRKTERRTERRANYIMTSNDTSRDKNHDIS